MSRAGRILAVLVAGALLGGCTGGGSSFPAPSGLSTPPRPTTSVAPSSVEPLRIERPRSPGRYGEYACTLLTLDEIVALDLDPELDGAQFPDVALTQCSWGRESAGNAWVQAIMQLDENPVADLLAGRKPPGSVVSRETVAGLPAAGLRYDLPQDGCRLTVALNDTQSLRVTFRDSRLPKFGDCADAVNVAELMVAKLPPLTR